MRSKTITGGEIMAHPSKDGVDKFMLHIKKAVNLRVEADRLTRWHRKMDGAELREESDKMLRDAEYMVYELIDGAMDQFVGRKGRLSKVTAALRSKNQGGNIPPATER
jgi:hypothetical protein